MHLMIVKNVYYIIKNILNKMMKIEFKLNI
jgi:hypothetical protein